MRSSTPSLTASSETRVAMSSGCSCVLARERPSSARPVGSLIRGFWHRCGMAAVELVLNAESPIAVVATTTTWEDLPLLWPKLLDEVWAELRRHHATTGHNVMVYEGVPLRVQIGVEVAEPIEPAGR